MSTNVRIDAERLADYFIVETSAPVFLEQLHEIIVEHVRMAGESSGYADLGTVAEGVSFLGGLYDAVKGAMVEE